MASATVTVGITLSGVWDDVASSLPTESGFVNVSIVPRGHRWLWVNWYPETYTFTAFPKGQRETEADGYVHVAVLMQPTGVIAITPAEWWRRAGYSVIDAIVRCCTLVKGGK